MAHSGLVTDRRTRRVSRRRRQWALARWGVAAPAAAGIAVAIARDLCGVRDTPLAIVLTIALLVGAGILVAALLRPPSQQLALVYLTLWSAIAVGASLAAGLVLR
jgi:hypothetical protein